MMRKLLLTTVAACGLIAPLAVAGAQTAQPPAAQAAPAKPAPMHRQPPVPMAQRAAQHLAQLQADLKLTPQQQDAWKAYSDVVTRQASDFDAKMKTRQQARQADGKPTPPTAIERLERRQQMATDAAQRTGEILAVARPLYDSLSPEQKLVADKELVPSHGPERAHGHMGPPPGGDMPPPDDDAPVK